MNKIAISLTTAFLLVSTIQAKQLESITVTAQKIQENPKDVPIAMSIFDEYKIKDNNIQNIADLANYTSGFYLFEIADNGSASPTIRGIHSDTRTFSSSVAMYIDGVPTYSTTGYNMYLHDIQRVEILKGPQGTLYGKNAEAGVINIITKKPNNEIKSNIGLKLANDKQHNTSFSVSGPIIKDNLFLGISAWYFKKDGFINNTYLNKTANDKKSLLGRINLRYLANDNLELSLISSYDKRRDKGTNSSTKAYGDPYNISFDFEELQDADTKSTAFKADYKLNENSSIEAISAYRDNDYLMYSDYDKTAIAAYKQHAHTIAKSQNISQEIRYKIDEKKYNYLLGVFLENTEEENSVKFDTTMGSTMFANQIVDGDTFGIFTHVDYKITNKLSLLGGIRYDKNTKELNNRLTRVLEKKSFSEVSPKIAIKYKINDEIMAYSTISKGFKAGGYFPYAPSGYEYYNQETLINYEIGLKSSLFDNSLNLNTSVYYIDISDKQVNVPISTFTNYMKNANSATSKGFELEAKYNLNEQITLFSSFAYNKATFKDFKYSSITTDRNLRVIGAKSVDNSGKNLPYAPKYTYGLGTQYRDVNGVYANINLNGYGSFFVDDSNSINYKVDPYALVDAKIGYENEDYDIYIYGKNIFDKKYNILAQYGSDVLNLSKPREIGVQLAYRF